MNRHGKYLLLLAGALLATSCVDETPLEVDEAPIEPAADMALAQQQEEEQGGNHRARLEVNFVVRGDLEPNTPITVDLKGVASEEIVSGTVEVALPTMAEMELAGPDKRLRHIPGGRPPVVARWQLPAMNAGDTWKESVQVGMIPEEGYYHITLIARTEGTFESPYLDDHAYRETWLFVADGAGRQMNFFDHSIFPDHIVPQPGPFEPWGPEASGSSSNQVGASMAAGAPRTFTVFFHTDSASNKDIGMKRAEYRGEYIERGQNVTTKRGTVPDDGYVDFPCTGYAEQYVTGRVWVPTTPEVNGGYTLSYWQARYSQCGDTIPVYGARHYYLPWLFLNYAIPKIEGHFRHYRSPVNYSWKDEDKSTAYSGWQDKIIYRPKSVDRHWTSAHEFGHALHHEELGGLWSAHCPDPHYVHRPSNYKCALQEGIADYLGDIGSPWPGYGGWERSPHSDAPSWRAEAEVEGNVAAFFHDLIDENNEGNDEVSLYAFDVARVFRTCRTSQGKREDIAAFVWCMENRFDADLHRTHFPGLNQTRNPISTRPSNWDADDIRSTWIYNIGKR